MNLFIIIYSGVGLVVGTAGPLPYDMTECKSRIAPMQAKVDARPEIAKGMRFACEFAERRPQLQEK